MGAGNYLYVTNRAGLAIVDVSDPMKPTKVAFLDLPNPSSFDGISVSNGYVYAGTGTADLYILQHSSVVE